MRYNLFVSNRSELIFEVIEDPECGFRAEALGYPIYTFGKDREELKRMVLDAADCYFTGEEGERPPIIRLHYASAMSSLQISAVAKCHDSG